MTETESIAVYVRSALAFGTILASTEVKIDRLAKQGHLSPHESTLLVVLRHALQDGSICREEDLGIRQMNSINEYR
jgi:hypothetical protein